MPRKRKSEPTITDTETAATTATIEPQPGKSAEPQADSPVLPQPAAGVEQAPSEQAPSFVERLGERTSRPTAPDPYLIALDSAAGVRLFENKQGRVMAIAFDEKPAQPVIDLIKEEGYRWNPTDRVWTHAIQRDTAMGTRIDAERLYHEICQMIRQDKGAGAGQDIPF
jgi:hypothetical protein